MQQPRISLDHWIAFKTVVDSGTYALAAETLNKSQSAISYAIANLNQQLPKPVLRLKGRKAELTNEGTVLYRYAEQLINAANAAEAVAKSMAMGFEAEVVIAVDVLVQVSSLVCSFEQFSQEFPHTRIRVLETSLSGTTEALLEKQADIVIGSQTPPGFNGRPLGEITMVPVAAPTHPLIVGRDEVSEFELSSHRQIVLRDTGTKRKIDAGWLAAQQRWTVSHFSTSIELLKSGMAFSFIPRQWAASSLAKAELAVIPLSQGFERKIPLYLMFADQNSAGPATKALASLVGDQLRNSAA
jgi:DNA-binding transcriptional LysR family regulator